MGSLNASLAKKEMHHMRICKLIASLCIACALMAGIFMLSAQDSGDSGTLSTAVARVLASIFVLDFNALDPTSQMEVLSSLAWPVRKTAHATEYACLCMSFCASCWQIWALRRERAGKGICSRRAFKMVCMLGFALAVLYACTDEVHQLFIDGRAGQVADVLVDASGALVGCLLSYLVLRLCFRKGSALEA